MKAKNYLETANLFRRYTRLDIGQFIDWGLSRGTNRVEFDIGKYLEWCENNGMKDNESIEEFNLRAFKEGANLNCLIKSMF